MIFVPAFIKPIYELYRDRTHVWVRCDSLSEAKTVADRVRAYNEIRPRMKTEVDFSNMPRVYVRVPKVMLGGTHEDEMIAKLKEPLNV